MQQDTLISDCECRMFSHTDGAQRDVRGGMLLGPLAAVEVKRDATFPDCPDVVLRCPVYREKVRVIWRGKLTHSVRLAVQGTVRHRHRLTAASDPERRTNSEEGGLSSGVRTVQVEDCRASAAQPTHLPTSRINGHDIFLAARAGERQLLAMFIQGAPARGLSVEVKGIGALTVRADCHDITRARPTNSPNGTRIAVFELPFCVPGDPSKRSRMASLSPPLAARPAVKTRFGVCIQTVIRSRFTKPVSIERPLRPFHTMAVPAALTTTASPEAAPCTASKFARVGEETTLHPSPSNMTTVPRSPTAQTCCADTPHKPFMIIPRSSGKRV